MLVRNLSKNTNENVIYFSQIFTPCCKPIVVKKTLSKSKFTHKRSQVEKRNIHSKFLVKPCRNRNFCGKVIKYMQTSCERKLWKLGIWILTNFGHEYGRFFPYFHMNLLWRYFWCIGVVVPHVWKFLSFQHIVGAAICDLKQSDYCSPWFK